MANNKQPRVKWQNTIKNKEGRPVQWMYPNYYQGEDGAFSGQGIQDQYNMDVARQLAEDKAAQVKQANEWVDKTGSQIGRVNKTSHHYSKVNTKDLDTNDPAAVKRIQESLVSTGALPATYINSAGEEVSSIDGQFGPMTEKAYRGEITKSREDMGLEGYQYNMLDNASNNTRLDLTDEDGNLFVDPNLDKSDAEMYNQNNNQTNNQNNPNNPPEGTVWDPISNSFIPDTGDGQGSVLDPNSEVRQDMDNQNKYWGPDALWNWMGYK